MRHLSQNKKDVPSWFLCLNTHFCRKACSATGKHTPPVQTPRCLQVAIAMRRAEAIWGCNSATHAAVRCHIPVLSTDQAPAATSSLGRVFHRHWACCAGWIPECAFTAWPNSSQITPWLSHLWLQHTWSQTEIWFECTAWESWCLFKHHC